MNSSEDTAEMNEKFNPKNVITVEKIGQITENDVVWGDRNKYKYGNTLIKTIIDDDKIVTVSPGEPAAVPTNKEWEKVKNHEKIGSDVYMNYDSYEYLVVDNTYQGNLEKIKPNMEFFPSYITYAHELIHAYHMLKGESNLNKKYHFYLDSNNKKHITGESLLDDFEIYNHKENRYYTAEEMYQNLMNNEKYKNKSMIPENIKNYETDVNYKEMQDKNSEVYKFFIETAEQKLKEAKLNNSKDNISINVPLARFFQEEFDTIGNKMGTKRKNEPTQNNIDNEHRGNGHNRGGYGGRIEW